MRAATGLPLRERSQMWASRARGGAWCTRTPAPSISASSRRRRAPSARGHRRLLRDDPDPGRGDPARSRRGAARRGAASRARAASPPPTRARQAGEKPAPRSLGGSRRLGPSSTRRKKGNMERLIASARTLAGSGRRRRVRRERQSARPCPHNGADRIGADRAAGRDRDDSARHPARCLGAGSSRCSSAPTPSDPQRPRGHRRSAAVRRLPHGSPGRTRVDAIGLYSASMTALNRRPRLLGEGDRRRLRASTSAWPSTRSPTTLTRGARAVQAEDRGRRTLCDDPGALRRRPARGASSSGWAGPAPVPLIVGVWPGRGATPWRSGCTTRCRGSSSPSTSQARLRDAGADAGDTGLAIARELVDASRELAAGVYLIPPFRQPHAALDLFA